MISTYKRLKRQRDAGEIEGGFTLIELLIVIVVLGILAAVVIFALGGITGKSAIAACQADGATIQTAVAAMEAQNPSVAAPTVDDLLSGGGLVGDPYLGSWPSNLPHYAFQFSAGGALQVLTGDTQTGTGTTADPYVYTKGTKNGNIVKGDLTTGPWIAYAGPTSCVDVS